MAVATPPELAKVQRRRRSSLCQSIVRAASPKMVTGLLRQLGTAGRRAKQNRAGGFFFSGRDRRNEQAPVPANPLPAREAILTVHVRDLRRSRRKRVLMRATLIAMDGVQQVRLKDLTSEGAGIACEVPLAGGTDVVLKRGDLFIAARVVWAEGMTAGLEFYRPVVPEDLAASSASA
jgi:hypothetical protein